MLGVVGQTSACVRVGTGERTQVPAYQAERADPPAQVQQGERAEAEAPPRDTGSETGSNTERPTETAATVTVDDAGDTVERGTASWYGEAHHGKTTASGEAFDMYAMTAAHPTLDMGTRVEVENLSNGRTVIVRINDRGPYADNRIIDVSMAAAQALGFVAAGTAEVEVRTLR